MNLWVPDPKTVVKFRSSGTGDMADVADDATMPRYGLTVPFVLAYLRAWATGGSSTAPLYMKQFVLDEPSRHWNRVVREWANFGAAGTGYVSFINFRVSPGDFHGFSWSGGDQLVFEWDNPDSGVTRWILEVGLAPSE